MRLKVPGAAPHISVFSRSFQYFNFAFTFLFRYLGLFCTADRKLHMVTQYLSKGTLTKLLGVCRHLPRGPPPLICPSVPPLGMGTMGTPHRDHPRLRLNLGPCTPLARSGGGETGASVLAATSQSRLGCHQWRGLPPLAVVGRPGVTAEGPPCHMPDAFTFSPTAHAYHLLPCVPIPHACAASFIVI